MEGVTGENIFLLKTAALYHDGGFVEKYMENEEIGARMAREVLPRFGYSEEQIKTVEKLIMATRVPQQPRDHLEKIICDADLDYLGRDDFHLIADRLRKEFLAHGVVQSDREWDELQVKFLTTHRYFTESAKKQRQPGKLKHLDEVKKRLEENAYA